MFFEYIYIYIYMNSITPKRHAETLQNWNISFQLKKQNIYRNEIHNLDLNEHIFFRQLIRLEAWHSGHLAERVIYG
jgi:hypothetical protein